MGIRNVLAKIDGKIILEDKFIWPTQRENDWYIMDRVMALSCFTNADIEGINACRRYLQSVTAADAADEAGTHIKSDFITGTQSTETGSGGVAVVATLLEADD